jgi:hypothetical protein
LVDLYNREHGEPAGISAASSFGQKSTVSRRSPCTSCRLRWGRSKSHVSEARVNRTSNPDACHSDRASQGGHAIFEH